MRDGVFVRELRRVQSAKSRIKVFDFHETGRKVPYTCTQCDEAWCLHACPVEAITMDTATGAKVVNEATCVGCKVCTIACPFGTINYVARNRQGAEMRPVRRRAGLRRRLPHRGHHLRRRRTGPGWTRCGNGPASSTTSRPATRTKGDSHGMDNESSARRSEQRHVQVRAAQHGSGRSEYLGQRGLATKYFVEEVDPKVDPLSPANKTDLRHRAADRHDGFDRRALLGRSPRAR